MPDAKTIIAVLLTLILSGLTWFSKQMWDGQQELKKGYTEIRIHDVKVDDAIEALSKNVTANTRTTDTLANITARLAELQRGTP